MFSLPVGNEMFHFPTFPPHALCVQARVTGLSLLPGFPIRKSSDHSSVDSSPRHIAASHVLLRLLVPRHPPCALNNLATKMLASTVQFSRYGRPHPHTPGHHRNIHGVPSMSGPFHNPPPNLTRGRGVTVAKAASAPSGPNSVPRPPRHRQPPFPTHRSGPY